jgi:hypothetical protein
VNPKKPELTEGFMVRELGGCGLSVLNPILHLYEGESLEAWADRGIHGTGNLWLNGSSEISVLLTLSYTCVKVNPKNLT